MASVTIRIDPQDPEVGDGFDVRLIEEDGRSAHAVLARSALTTGNLWRVSFDGALPPPPARDIASFVSNLTPAQRNHPDLDSLAATLHDWMLPQGPVRQRWADVFDSRVYLQIGDETLERLPWELICPATPPEWRPALIGGLCRLNPRDEGRAPPASARCSEWPFRILVVIGCNAAEEVALGVNKEVRAIERAFHPLGRSVDVHCMIRPREQDLKDWIGRFAPHVFHFAGHTEKAPGLERYGLRIENEEGPWTWYSGAIDNDLPRLRWCPKFVFLNACRSSTEQGGWSAHRSFMAAGTKAAIGMQADVNGSHSAAFAARLYTELAGGAGLEDALFEARARLPGPPDISWALPAMSINERNAKFFAARPPPSGPAYEKCGEFDEVRLFANCRETRRVLTDWVFPCRATEKPKNILLLLGDPTAGKSHVMKWTIENWAICGARVRYIKLDNGSAKTFVSVLRLIRDGDAHADQIKTHYLHDALPAAAFRPFTWHLNTLTRTGVVGEWSEAAHVGEEIRDDFLPLSARGENRPEEQIGPIFVEALRRAAEGKPLILVFDQLDSKGALMPADEFKQLFNNVLLPAADTLSNLVKIAIVATHDQAADLELTSLPSPIDGRVFVHKMTSVDDDAKIPSLVAEMIWFQDEATILRVAELVFRLPRNEFPPPRGLARLVRFKEMFNSTFPNLVEAVKRMR